MKRILSVAIALGAIMGSATVGHSQATIEGGYYVVKDASGGKRVIGPANPQGMAVMMHVGGKAPHSCATGAFWESASGTLMACAGGGEYDLVAPEAGAMMADGSAYPAGAMVMKKH